MYTCILLCIDSLTFNLNNKQMDSPVFGRPAQKKTSAFPRLSPDKTVPSKDVQYAMAVLHLTRHLRKLATAIKRVELKNKRNSFSLIRQPRLLGFIGHKEFVCVLEVERKLMRIHHIFTANFLMLKLRGWQALKNKTLSDGWSGKRSSTIPRKTNQKKGQEWKKNSSSNNILDVSGENKRLKGEISKEQSEEESFIEKMSSLLDSHDRSKGAGNRKRK